MLPAFPVENVRSFPLPELSYFKPKLVFIDETMANMDPESIRTFESIFTDIQTQDSYHLVIVSHQPTHIYNLCQEVQMMEAVSSFFSGTPKEMGYFMRERHEKQWSY